MSKQYCNICFFFKEDTLSRLHPQLLKQGIVSSIDLCDTCFEGLKNRKSHMRQWVNEKVRVVFTPFGPEQKIDDLTGMLITKVSYCILSNVSFIVNQHLQRGYVQGLLQSYAFHESSHSIRDWKEVLFRISYVLKDYVFVDSSFSIINYASKFMLLDGRGYIQL